MADVDVPGRVPLEGATAWSSYTILISSDKPDALGKVRAKAAALGSSIEWVATEKVHGANFCFETDGTVVEYASRTRKLVPTPKANWDNFYSASATMPKYHQFVLRAFDLVKERRPEMQRLLVYGEYFGGYFPGKPPVKGLQKVQKGVAYSPEHHFYAFDVSPDGKGYLDFDEAREILLAAGFPLVAAPLLRGTFDELIATDVEVFETTIPAQLGLPLPPTDRIAEGLVIRPAREPRDERFGRMIVKKKAEAFWEAIKQPRPAKEDKGAVADALIAVVEEGRGMFNEARLRAVISKDPDLLQERMFEKLVWEFASDVLKDLGDQADAVDRKQLAQALSELSRRVATQLMPDIRADVAGAA